MIPLIRLDYSKKKKKCQLIEAGHDLQVSTAEDIGMPQENHNWQPKY